MLFVPLLYFCFVQVPNVVALFDFIIGRQKICICRCGILRPVANGLLGGDAVAQNQYPWLVTVTADARTFSGALVSDRHIVTVASLLYGIPDSDVTATLGTRDRCGINSSPVIAAEAVIIHPNFSPTTTGHDIALVRLSHPVNFDNSIAPICLPTAVSDRPSRVAILASWGDYSYQSGCIPKVSSLPILESGTCLTSAVNSTWVTVDKGCLGPVGAASSICQEDVGAPVMTQWIPNGSFRLIGIISSTSCKETTTPLYTRVYDHISWIRTQIRSDCQCL